MFRVVGLPKHAGNVQAVMVSPPTNRTRSKMFLRNGVASLPLVRAKFQRFDSLDLFQLDDGRATHPASTQEAFQQAYIPSPSKQDKTDALYYSSLRTLITKGMI